MWKKLQQKLKSYWSHYFGGKKILLLREYNGQKFADNIRNDHRGKLHESHENFRFLWFVFRNIYTPCVSPLSETNSAINSAHRDSRFNRVKMPIYPAGGNKGDAFSRTNDSQCRYIGEGERERGGEVGEERREKNSKRVERVCYSVARRCDRLSQHGWVHYCVTAS